ncbi:hypothetical protein [uncultured Marinobacter sp.]|uniref:hypothetical protein n=1 Tax=uncultured Marinobacter sp. TaxID=187379 RepID=UPI0030D8C51B
MLTRTMTSRFESKSTRLDEMRSQVKAFHSEHPEVWDLFVRFTQEKINRGFKHYSARGIFHRIRWETEEPSYQAGKEFKLNDHYSPFYARSFHRIYPQHDGFFRTRRQTSQEDFPTRMPALTPEDFGERDGR